MSTMRQMASATESFLVDYCRRHKHPANALLHIIGVPMVFAGLYEACRGQLSMALALVVLGYVLQYLGHKAQGNEVGEVTLIKKLWRRFRGART